MKKNLAKCMVDISESILSNPVATPPYTDEQSLRTVIASELSSINVYQQMMSLTTNVELQKQLDTIVKDKQVAILQLEHTLAKIESSNQIDDNTDAVEDDTIENDEDDYSFENDNEETEGYDDGEYENSEEDEGEDEE